MGEGGQRPPDFQNSSKIISNRFRVSLGTENPRSLGF